VVLILAILGLGLGLWRGGTAAAPDVGRRAPSFTLELADGGTVTLAQYRGRPLVVNFWATWCPPCVDELPALQRLADEDDVAVLAVNLGDTAAEVAAFLRRHDLRLPVALDTRGEVMTHYRVAGLPQTFFIDRDGVIRHVERSVLTYEAMRAIAARLADGGGT